MPGFISPGPDILLFLVLSKHLLHIFQDLSPQQKETQCLSACEEQTADTPQ